MKSKQLADFKWRHFQGEIILQCVRWYCKYGISYRNLKEMMSERALSITPLYIDEFNTFRKGQFNC